MSSMPTPHPQMKQLERLAGTWEGEETVHPSPFDPAGGSARATVRNTIAADGFALVQDYEQDRGRPEKFRGHGFVHHDPVTSQFVFQWIDNSGMGAGTFRGGFEGDVLSLVQETPAGRMRATWTLDGGETYRYRMDVSPDGASWFPFLEGVYRRRV